MSSIRISIVIPTYNRAHLISRAIQSVIRQSVSYWELIVVDDGSTDNTSEVIKPFLDDKRIKYVLKENSGAAESRNIGVQNSTSEFITFLDSDDEAVEVWLERMSEKLVPGRLVVVCCGMERFDAVGSSSGVVMPASLAPLFPDVIASFTNGGVFLMHRSLFEGVGGFDPELRSSQHTELFFRLIPFLQKRQIPILNIMEPLIKIHIHGGPRIRHNSRSIFLGVSRVLEKHSTLLRTHPQLHNTFLSIAGVTGVQSKHYAKATQYFRSALSNDPVKLKYWMRWMISTVPILRDMVWKRPVDI